VVIHYGAGAKSVCRPSMSPSALHAFPD